jgi:hypothetical protein
MCLHYCLSALISSYHTCPDRPVPYPLRRHTIRYGQIGVINRRRISGGHGGGACQFKGTLATHEQFIKWGCPAIHLVCLLSRPNSLFNLHAFGYSCLTVHCLPATWVRYRRFPSEDSVKPTSPLGTVF